MHNKRRAERYAKLGPHQLIRIVDAGTLSSAAASYALRQQYGIIRVVDMGRL
jgi:hypothetical protein